LARSVTGATYFNVNGFNVYRFNGSGSITF
jgi:hypothetical protein